MRIVPIRFEIKTAEMRRVTGAGSDEVGSSGSRPQESAAAPRAATGYVISALLLVPACFAWLVAGAALLVRRSLGLHRPDDPFG